MSVLVAGYGQTGPMSQRAGYDAIASAMSGLMHITGPEVGILRIFLFISLIHAKNKLFFNKLYLNEFWEDTGESE